MKHPLAIATNSVFCCNRTKFVSMSPKLNTSRRFWGIMFVKDSTCETRENIFYFTSKTLFVPVKIKF